MSLESDHSQYSSFDFEAHQLACVCLKDMTQKKAVSLVSLGICKETIQSTIILTYLNFNKTFVFKKITLVQNQTEVLNVYLISREREGFVFLDKFTLCYPAASVIGWLITMS